MRRSVVFGAMRGFACSIHAQQGKKDSLGQTQPALATVHLHISASHLRLNCRDSDIGFGRVSCDYGLSVDAVLNGKKIELWGASKIGKQYSALLVPGDYTAQLTYDDHNADRAVISRGYKLLLPDGVTWQRPLSGIAESFHHRPINRPFQFP